MTHKNSTPSRIFPAGSVPFSEIKKKSVYFIGIGGIGMSALARWFLAQKWSVSGSDVVESDITRALEKEGVRVKIGQKRAHIGRSTGLFIYNQAISEKNEERAEAEKKKAPLLSYAEAVGFLTRYYDTYAVAGAHGKSTTSSLLSLALVRAKKSPTVIVGTLLSEFGGKNFRKGSDHSLVLEADEFHGSFLNYAPQHAIITNIDREHLDWYERFENVQRAFLEFVKNMRPGGFLILNKDNARLCSLAKKITSICERKNITIVWYSLRDRDAEKVRRAMAHVSGTHMISNAYAAFLLARILGAKEKDILGAFRAYHGVWRRMEYKGKIKIQKSAIDVYDDYAHHPTEIATTLKGAREFFKKKNIICAFQPHQEKRLSILFPEFIKAFDSVHALFLFPVYRVAGREASAGAHTAENLARRIAARKKIKELTYLEDFSMFLPFLINTGKDGKLPYRDSVLIMMGAGNINEETKKILKKIK